MECVGEGWRPLIRLLITKVDELNRSDGPVVTVAQVKEKFGGLRFYTQCDVPLDPRYLELTKLIDQVETACWHICEACGSTTLVTTRSPLGTDWGWQKTYCGMCHHERDVLKLAEK